MARDFSKTNPDDLLASPAAKPVLRLVEAIKRGEKNPVENCYFCEKPIKMESFENVSSNGLARAEKATARFMAFNLNKK